MKLSQYRHGQAMSPAQQQQQQQIIQQQQQQIQQQQQQQQQAMPPESPQPPQSPFNPGRGAVTPTSPFNVQPQTPSSVGRSQTPNSPLPPHQYSGGPNSPMPNRNIGQNSPLHPMNPTPPPQSPRHTPFAQPPSPVPPQSPKVQHFSQPPSPRYTPSGQYHTGHSSNPSSPAAMMRQSNSPLHSLGSPGPGLMRRTSNPNISPAHPMGSPQGDNSNGSAGSNSNSMGMIPVPPELLGRFKNFKMGLFGGSPMWNTGRPAPKHIQTTVAQSSTDGKSKVPSLVSLDYNDFDDENSSSSPSTSKSRVDKEKKPEDNMEHTVYDDIVLVESCKGESNLEVEELQSALENNVMSAVVSMEMGSLDSDAEGMLHECMDNSDLVVLNVPPDDNEDAGDVGDLMELEDNKTEDEEDLEDLKALDDESEMELEEEVRRHLPGKVMPGESDEAFQHEEQDEEDVEEKTPQLVPVIIPSSTVSSSSINTLDSSQVQRPMLTFHRQHSQESPSSPVKSVIMQKANTKLTSANVSTPRMSIPFSLTGTSHSLSNAHYVPILSETDKPGVLKLEGIKILPSASEAEHPTILVQKTPSGGEGQKETVGNREPTISTHKLNVPSTILNIPSDVINISDVIDSSRKINLFNSANIKASMKSNNDFKNALIINSDKQIQNMGDKISSLMSSTELDARPGDRSKPMTSQPIILHTRMSGSEGMASPKLIRIERRASGTDKDSSSFIPLSSIIAQKSSEVTTSQPNPVSTSEEPSSPAKDTRNVLLKQLLKNSSSLTPLSSNDKINDSIASALQAAKESMSKTPYVNIPKMTSAVTIPLPDNEPDSSQSAKLGSVSSSCPSLEEQLDKPVSPTSSSLIPPLHINENLLKKPTSTSQPVTTSKLILTSSGPSPSMASSLIKSKPKITASDSMISSSSSQPAPSTTTIVVIQQVTSPPTTTSSSTTRVPVVSEQQGKVSWNKINVDFFPRLFVHARLLTNQLGQAFPIL